jgi:type II secretory ATPase GspE/PulE/Tfp pilus assembly ATPase PilB-like protein
VSAQKVAKELSRLSYTDMQLLATKLTNRINEDPNYVQGLNKVIVADALATLKAEFDDSPDAVDESSTHLLKKAFSSRAKNIHVTVLKEGFQVTFGKYQGAGQRLPDAINDLLDQIIVMKAMGVS